MTQFVHAISVLCLGAAGATAGATMPAQVVLTDQQPAVSVSRAVPASAMAVDEIVSKSLSQIGNELAPASVGSLVPRGAAAAPAPEEESAAGLGLVLSSWGVVALIAIRRLFG